MAKILAQTILAPGHLNPFLPILIELQSRGHEIVIAVPAPATATLPSSVAGIRIQAAHPPTSTAPLLVVCDPPTTAPSDTQRTFAVHGEPIAGALASTIAAERPDCIIADPMLWGGLIVAEASGLPWASVSHNPYTLRASGQDARGPGLRPPKGWLGRFLHRAVAEHLLARSDRDLLPTMNAVRSRRGLHPLPHVDDAYRQAPLTIAATAEPFEYPRDDWPPAVRFVGPLGWEPPMPAPDWLDDLDERPLVLVVGSSIPEHGAARTWVRVALESLALEPIQVIATLPADDVPERLPANVRVTRYLPHGLLLPRAACVVCHGGPGITQKALSAGVPVVAVPFAHDRFEVARRVEVAGAGVRLAGKDLSPGRLRAAVRRAMRCRPGAQRIARAFREAGGAPAAASAVEELLRDARDVQRGAALP